MPSLAKNEFQKHDHNSNKENGCALKLLKLKVSATAIYIVKLMFIFREIAIFEFTRGFN